MTSGLVNASLSLPEWQAVKMIFFAPWEAKNILQVRNANRPPCPPPPYLIHTVCDWWLAGNNLAEVQCKIEKANAEKLVNVSTFWLC